MKAETTPSSALFLAVRALAQSQREMAPLVATSREQAMVASVAQQRLWFLEQLMSEQALHNLAIAYRMRGNLSVAALAKSLTEMVRRHEILRTTFHVEHGQLIQTIQPADDLPLPVADLRAWAQPWRDDEVMRRLHTEARRRFDLTRAPLMRGYVLRYAARQWFFVLTVHHLVFDGYSFGVFMRELCALYTAYRTHQPSPLPPLTVHYADYAVWQRTELRRGTYAPQLCYWQTQMEGAPPVLRLPSDRPQGRSRQGQGACQSTRIAPELTEALKKLASKEGVTLFMLLLATFKTLLYRYTGETDVVVGTPMANRNRREVAGMIGLFVNTLPLRTRLCGQWSFRALLQHVREVVAGAYQHQELPFETLVQALNVPRDSHGLPLVQVMFTYLNVPKSAWTFPDIEVEATNVDNGAAKFVLTLSIGDTEKGMYTWLEYDTSLFDVLTITSFLAHFHRLLEEVVENPAQCLTDIPMLSASERQAIIAQWNEIPQHTLDHMTSPYAREATIHEVFEVRVQAAPEDVALVFGPHQLSYQALNSQANQLARYLQQQGVQPETLVGVYLERSSSFVIALLAILKAGGAFVPMDVKAPRRSQQSPLACMSLVVTCQAYHEQVAELNAAVVSIDAEAADIRQQSSANLDVNVSADNLAYVMFTSGSTGEPKGVCIPHRGVVRLVQGTNYATFDALDVFFQHAPLSFDASTFEVWGALLNGARLVIAPAHPLSLAAMGALIRSYKVTVLWLTSRLFELFVDAELSSLRGVRQLLVGGEVLSVAHAERFVECAYDCKLINVYGPTENTTFTSFYPVVAAVAPGEASIPIGTPVAHSQIYVLDEHRQPVPRGVAGEIYIGGDGLMRGYLDDAALTQERLIPNPFAGQPGTHLYRTGDWARHRSDGNLEFLGRKDTQVKIRGFRVEPLAIERILDQCPLVQRSVVLPFEPVQGGKRLVAYIVAAQPIASPQAFRASLRDYMHATLPAYQVPAAVVPLDRLPLLANGKLDRGALPRPDSAMPMPGDAAPRAINDDEQAIVDAFEKILGREGVGLEDHFFQLGGDSLLALQLVAQLDVFFHTTLPLVGLFEHPTVRRLAAYIRQLQTTCPTPSGARPPATSALVDMRHGKAKMPLFLIPGGHGGMIELMLYAKAMCHLPSDQAVYGIRAQGLDGVKAPHASVEVMATAYIADLRARQPTGPYALCGECVGGVVAFEMAQQLAAQHQEVALLLLMDTWCPTPAAERHYYVIEKPLHLLKARLSALRQGVSYLHVGLRNYIRERPPFGPLAWCKHGRRFIAAQIHTVWAIVQSVRAVGKTPIGAENVFAAEINYIEVAMRYRPQVYPGRVIFLACANNAQGGIVDNWRRVAGGGLEVHVVAGNHESYFTQSDKEIAEIVQTCLEDAARGTVLPL